jgi:branched-chain amino acid transport system permease protein
MRKVEVKALQQRVPGLMPNPAAAIGRSAAPFAVAIVLALVMDLIIAPAAGLTWTKILLDVGIAIVLAGSLNVVNGYAGQFSLGQAGFMLVGAYAAAFLTFYGSMHFISTCPPDAMTPGCFTGKGPTGGFLGSGQLLFLAGCILGGVVASLLGVLVGLPSLRLRGDYLAIVTLGFGEIVRVFGQITSRQPKNVEDIQGRSLLELANNLGGAEGFSQIPDYTAAGTGGAMFFVFSFAFILLVLIYRLKYSSKGRALLAVRENEIAAEAMGVDTTRSKVVAFVFSAFFAGIGGALYAHQVGAIDPKELGFQKSIDLVIIVVIGGMGSITGVVLGASILVVLPELFREFSEYRMIVYALALIVVMILRPQGVMGVQELWDLAWTRPAWWKKAVHNLKTKPNAIAIGAFAAGLGALLAYKYFPVVGLIAVLALGGIVGGVFGRLTSKKRDGSGAGWGSVAMLLGIIALMALVLALSGGG